MVDIKLLYYKMKLSHQMANLEKFASIKKLEKMV